MVLKKNKQEFGFTMTISRPFPSPRRGFGDGPFLVQKNAVQEKLSRFVE